MSETKGKEGYSGGFAFVVVLFILLIIVGSSYVGGFRY
ncbi:YjcZ family sporulation protein [Virgibacillus sp. MSJ-26]|nr:YjcZ family sporulation protein [Virgibacillus sp. MSJ-26]MBU5466889.1 YjcZ family sporulation protein [Virgibacillus sp. MSJ-26]